MRVTDGHLRGRIIFAAALSSALLIPSGAFAGLYNIDVRNDTTPSIPRIRSASSK